MGVCVLGKGRTSLSAVEQGRAVSHHLCPGEPLCDSRALGTRAGPAVSPAPAPSHSSQLGGTQLLRPLAGPEHRARAPRLGRGPAAWHTLTGPQRAKRHAAVRRHHAQLMRVGCVLGTCQVQNLGHRLWQLMGQSGRQDSSPINPSSPHSYG
uniref:Adrenomedullin 2 n=1 Tax=Pelusios castaneus TaxID=367368 RepID=A0A8C8S8C0_9SAUR